MQNRLIEMAVARTGAETELTIAAFRGPVLRKRKNSAANSAGTAHLCGPKNNITPHGSVSATLHAESKYSARWFRFNQMCAIQPPTSVAMMPSTTVVAPTVRLAVLIDIPASRRRNSGIQKEIP